MDSYNKDKDADNTKTPLLFCHCCVLIKKICWLS